MQDLSAQSSSTNSQKIGFKLVQNKCIEKGRHKDILLVLDEF